MPLNEAMALLSISDRVALFDNGNMIKTRGPADFCSSLHQVGPLGGGSHRPWCSWPGPTAATVYMRTAARDRATDHARVRDAFRSSNRRLEGDDIARRCLSVPREHSLQVAGPHF